jgi:hypothetical protein
MSRMPMLFRFTVIYDGTSWFVRDDSCDGYTISQNMIGPIGDAEEAADVVEQLCDGLRESFGGPPFTWQTVQ